MTRVHELRDPRNAVRHGQPLLGRFPTIWVGAADSAGNAVVALFSSTSTSRGTAGSIDLAAKRVCGKHRLRCKVAVLHGDDRQNTT